MRDHSEMENSVKHLQEENYTLREYILHLQTRLIDAGIEPPLPPPNVNLVPYPEMPGTIRHDGLPPEAAEEDIVMGPSPVPNTGSATGAASLDAVAQAVQSLSRSEAAFKAEPESQAAEDARTAEAISNQLSQAESAPAANM